MSNHLLHSPLPEGSLLELSPTQVALGRLDDEVGGYAITATDGTVSIRIVLPPEDFTKLIRSASEKLDEAGAGSGKLEIARALPPSLAKRR